MKFKLIYPRWPKLMRQTEFHLPPHGPVVFAATLPHGVDVEFVDENLESLDFDAPADVVGISMMLTAQVKRGWAIADAYRARGVPVIFGGIATMLHAEETQSHADAVFLGEAEGRMEQVLADLKAGQLKKRYDYLADPPPVELVGPARRDILKRELYNYRGIQMVDLVHASRGCRYNCYPCCVAYLGGRQFRPRPIDMAVAEMAAIDNNRMFIVDNSLAQDTQWELDLFREMIPLKKKWCCHPIEDDPKVLDLAAQAGAWYVYQAVFDTSDKIRDRIKRYHDHGIGVEGTILLGLDNHTEDDILRLIDFLLEIELDLAEFTVLTPFPHTKAYEDLKRKNRILSFDWNEYTADKVVFQPKHMSAERLQELLTHAWDTFYRTESQGMKMSNLFQQVMRKEKADGTFRPRNRSLAHQAFGRAV
ncbi:B12-binding domain-containing radical SAM protein [Desulfosarcina sp.]|uniref:B12-binding domain-containing radical SAM protein n=1 Tax=Desulfosarcina sp. TaxID=2027861 RepID=UPI0029AB760C|nr:cobalamin-dependent protein [Desulfosarcina sp.]MDX2451312.1 cobalamin-dependent protein [Desulfosarcina sp.]MDX2489135.1 cobalamin-dependent protein [Desulfosarcina sp.]